MKFETQKYCFNNEPIYYISKYYCNNQYSIGYTHRHRTGAKLSAINVLKKHQLRVKNVKLLFKYNLLNKSFKLPKIKASR